MQQQNVNDAEEGGYWAYENSEIIDVELIPRVNDSVE